MNRTFHKLLWLWTNLCRLVLAAVFIFSGFVKAVDPSGTQYKMEDYFDAFHLTWIPDFLPLLLAVGLCMLEFVVGVFLLFGIRRRATTLIALLLMLFMTPLTLYLAIVNPVSDCGCFGDAWVLTNWQTFGKNVLLLVAAITVFRWPRYMWRFISERNQWIVSMYTIFFIAFFAVYNLFHLPLFDFRPYHIGANLPKGMEVPAGAAQSEFENIFIMEKDGVRKEFSEADYPDDDAWTFIDRKQVQTKIGYEPPIHDFVLQEVETGDDITEKVLSDSSYTFLLIAPWLAKADDSHADLINELYDYCTDHGYAFYCLTSSTGEELERWRDGTGAEYPFCNVDATTLKTIVRANPGLVLLKNGTVMNKWGNNDFPNEYQLNAPLDQLSLAQLHPVNTWNKLLGVLSWYVLPLLLVAFLDRLWMGSKYFRKLRHKNNTNQSFKIKKKMRKKIVAGNWKMNKNLQEGIELAKGLNDALKADKPNCEVIICTPFIHLASVTPLVDSSIIGVGAENCADKVSGAYTGEVSAEMVKSTGAQYVILGHSERRGYYGETPAILKEKVQLALENGLKVIFCIGESLEEREANKQNAVVKAELEGSVFNLSAEDFAKIVIAYEPIWAIGTGKTATAEQAEEIHAYIRSCVADKYGAAVADNTSILYGGSCKASNAPELFSKPDIDGGLIGGASLKVPDFKGIIDAWKK